MAQVRDNSICLKRGWAAYSRVKLEGRVMITCDLNQSKRRQHRLKAYLTANVLSNNQFLCANFRECKSSHLGTFYEGQLHHVGDYYDLSMNGKPLRVVVVGMSYGHKPAKVTMEKRRHKVLVETGLEKEFKAGNVLPPRNFHMKGTTNLLRLLFGIPPGIDHASEFLQINDNDKVHMFDAFSLVNYLLCSAIKNDDSTTDKSTRTMRQNCRDHFRHTLEILEPTIAVVQGKGFQDLVKNSMDSVKSIDNSNIVYRVQLGKNEFHLLTFSHPSARNNTGWASESSPYLLNTIAPIVKKIRFDEAK
ncbi:MAG: hypothetical protein ABIG63_12830 [Chloroflexota bacterium]